MNKVKLIITSILCVILFRCSENEKTRSSSDRAEVYEANWESLSMHKAAPEWFVDAKLGIYFHWGPYSVPAFGGAWYPRNMYIENSKVQKFHEENFGKIGAFDYPDFIPMFTAEHFDPEEWAELFESSGAKFAGPVA